jgi:Flp pilus assembly protein CpaB
MTVDYRIRNVLIAAALAAAAVLLTVIYVTSAREDDAAAKQSVTVFTAAKAHGVGTSAASIADTMQKTTVAKSALVKDAVTSPTQLEGLYLVQPVVAGEQLTLQRFALPTEQGVRAKLVGRQRAVQVAGDANQVLKGTLVAGDRVDVVANLKSTNGLGQPETGTVLRNIRVLETGDSENTSVDNPSDSLHAVVLGMTDAQAQDLYFATKNGDWSLVLRPVKKPKDSAETVVTYDTVLGGGR